MCLIINRPANTVLDFEKFKTAIINNPDGWGLSASVGDGRLQTYRSPKEADPDKLFKFITEEFKEVPVLLHLRYTTAGETSLRNAHPFPILEKATDGVDLRMAHNGTLHPYKTKGDESDTRNFTKTFVRPLFKRLIRGWSIEEILKDDWVKWVLDGELSAQSVLSFIDGAGHTFEVNALGNGGFYDDNGVYYSNKYSFDPEHRLPNYVKHQYGYGGNYYGGNYGHQNNVPVPPKPQGQEASPPATQQSSNRPHAKDTQTMKFTQKYELSDAADLLDMDDDFIDLTVDSHPEDAKLLIKELLAELYNALEGDEE